MLEGEALPRKLLDLKLYIVYPYVAFRQCVKHFVAIFHPTSPCSTQRVSREGAEVLFKIGEDPSSIASCSRKCLRAGQKPPGQGEDGSSWHLSRTSLPFRRRRHLAFLFNSQHVLSRAKWAEEAIVNYDAGDPKALASPPRSVEMCLIGLSLDLDHFECCS